MSAKRPTHFRPTVRAIALEQRLLFDGAGAVATGDSFDIDVAVQSHQDQRQPAAAEQRSNEALESSSDDGVLFIIDSRVTLPNSLPAGAIVRYVEAGESGLDAVGDALSKGGSFDAVHIISHGEPGEFMLGSDVINSASLSEQAAQLQEWAEHLSESADILLYGCDIASADGDALITELARLTGADIAASIDATGALDKGGNWVLEASTGIIEAALTTTPAALLSYDGLLAATDISDSEFPTARVTTEDIPTAISGLSVTGGAADLITLTIDTTGGTSSLGSTTGLTVTDNASSAITVQGTIADVNGALTTLVYTPTENQNSSTAGFTPSVALNVIAGGAGSLTISDLSVSAFNDAPDLGSKSDLVVDEGSSNSPLSLAQLASSANALDIDIATGQQVIEQHMVVINSLPMKGTLSYLGGAAATGQVIPVTNLGSLTYTHNGADISATDSDSFNVTVSDGGGGQTSSSIGISINPTNKAPTISGSPTLIEGQVKAVAPDINLGDIADTLATSTIEITAVDDGNQGTLFFDANNDGLVDAPEVVTAGRTFSVAEAAELSSKLKFIQDGTEPNQPAGVTKPTYTISVTDAGGGEGAGATLTTNETISITVLPNNDDPTLTNAHADAGAALSIDEGVTAIITNAMLAIADVDLNPANTAQTTPPERLVYSISTRPTQGELQLFVGAAAGPDADGWVVLGDGGRFTQAQVDAGELRYYQTVNVAAATPDNFFFTVRDSAFGDDVWTDPANPTGGREGGLRDTPTGAIATQQFNFNITADTPRTNPYEGAPRPATQGYGGGNLTYSFVAVVPNPGNSGSTWNEANLGAGGGYPITQAMLEYTIERRDDNGTPGNLADDVFFPVPASETVYTVTSQPANGVIQRFVGGVWQAIPTNGQFTQAEVNTGTTIRFVHDGGEDHLSTFGYKVSDGTPNNFTGSFAIDIDPINDRPAASAGAPAQVREGDAETDLAGNPDSTVRLGLSQLGMSDVDESLDISKRAAEGAEDFLWFQVSAQPVDGAATERGEIQRWNGAAWTAITPGEWLPSSLLFVSAEGENSGLRYVHDGSEPLIYTGGPKVTFSYTVRDDLSDPADPFADNNTPPADNSGTGQSNQSAPSTATINIIPVNDAPIVADKPSDADPIIAGTITGGGAISGFNVVLSGVLEGSTGNIINGTQLATVDRDNTTTQRQYRITQVPTGGVLQLNGAKLGLGSTFSQADIDANKLTYSHSGDEVAATITDGLGTYNDKFNFVVSDGVLSDSGNVFLITLNVANDLPLLDFETQPGVTDLFIVDSAATAKTIPKIVLEDPDLDDGILQVGEQDFVQVTVEFLTAADAAYAPGVLNFDGGVPGDIQLIGAAGSNTLVFQGALSNVQAALDKVQARVNADDATNPSDLKIKVTLDDQLRDAAGAIIAGANGGVTNGELGKETVNDANNRASIEFQVAVSAINNPPAISAPITTAVLEDFRSTIPGITFTDPDAFNSTDNTLTVSVVSGRLYFAASGNGVPGGSSVSAGAVGSSTVTLTGTKAQLDAALAQVRYLGTADNNGVVAAATDDTLTIAVNDGGNTGVDGGSNTDSETVAINITAVNDAPTLVVGTGIKVLTPNVATAIDGIVITDKDIRGDIAANGANDLDVLDNEFNFVQATVRVVQENGTDWDVLASTSYNNAGVSIINITSTSAPAEDGTFEIDDTHSGAQSALVIRGTLDQVNTYLAGLTLRMDGTALANADTGFGLEVILDDRSRNVTTGALTGGTANGGLNPDGASTSAPPVTVINPYADTPVGLNLNVATGIREVLPSDTNDPATITGALAAAESNNNYVTLAGLDIADPDALATNVLKATVTLPTDFTISSLGASGGTFVGVVGGTSFTIEGTLAQINARLDTLRIALPNVPGDAIALDWNGTFNVTVVVEDQGNNGDRPAVLAAGDNATTGTFAYADNAVASVDSELITTRTISFAVAATNDAPVAKPVAGTRDTNLPDVNEDPGHAPGDGAGTNKTVSELFSPYFDDSKDEIQGNQVASANAGTGTNADSMWGAAVVGNAATAAQGQWQYFDGATWVAIPTNVANNRALILDNSTPVRFSPAANFFGVPNQLSVRLIEGNANGDTTSTVTVPASGTANSNIGTPGGSSRYSSDVITLGVQVNNVNDRPTAANGSVQTAEDIINGGTGVLVSSLSTTLNFSDVIDGTAATTFGGVAIVGDTTSAGGSWEYSTDAGGTWTSVAAGVTDTTAVILGNADKLRFVPDPNYNGTPTGGLTVRVADSAQVSSASANISATVADASSVWSATTTLGVSVSTANDAPDFSHTPANPTAVESAGTGSTTTAVKLLSAAGAASDIDLGTTAALSNSVFGSGTVTVTLTDGITGDTLRLDGLVAGANGIATIAGGANGAALVVGFTNAATLTQVETVLQAIEYLHSGDDPTDNLSGTPKPTRAYTIELNDGNNAQAGGNAGGPNPLAISKAGTITITPTNDNPVATPNTNTVTEDSGLAVTGNVKTDAVSDSDLDNVMSDVPVTAIVATTATGASTPVLDNAGAGTEVTGKYGTLTIKPDGSYSYVLDDSNPDVNALNATETLTEVFDYTITDPDSQADSSTLTITIDGQTDGNPAIVATDGNAGATGQATVYEKGLTSITDTQETTTGAINIKAPDGIKSVTIGGTVITVADLQAIQAGTDPALSIDTGEGTLQITGITVVTGAAGAPTEANVSYTYTLKEQQDQPAATESSDIITLVVTDNSSTPITDSGTLTIQIIDDTPTAQDDTETITKGVATVTGNVINNDSIGGDGTATPGPVTAITGGAPGTALNGVYGAITLNADGTYSYALDNANPTVVALLDGQTLTETFTYTITDKDGDTSVATVDITINGVTPNALPVATDDLFTLNEDTSLTDVLTGNDTPSTDGGNVWSINTGPANGTATVNPNGTFVYTPNPNYNGPDSFTYTITDSDGDTSTATVTLTVLPVNDLPVAVADSATTNEDSPVSGSLVGNDTPSGDGGNIWSKATDPANGTVTVNPDGSYTYTPNPGFSGTDSFEYTITDVDGDESTATATITIVAKNGLPVAASDSASTDQDTPISGSLVGNDTPSTDGGNIWTKTTDPANGTVTVNPDGSYTYTPNPGFSGTDSFEYTITDVDGDESTATVTITIVAKNGLPVAVSDSASTDQDTPITGSLAGNDTPSPDGDNTWSKTTDPVNGTVTVNPDGSFSYTPNPGFTGTDSFIYTITDIDGDQSSASVDITVTGTVVPPDTAPEIDQPNPSDPAFADPNIAGQQAVNNFDGSTNTNGPDGFLPPNPFYPLNGSGLDNSPVVVNTGPYSFIVRHNNVYQLALPFHPIAFVNQQVQEFQLERQQTDHRFFSDARTVTPNTGDMSSQTSGLGQDPNLFVTREVQASQSQADFFNNIVNGRRSRIDLSNDGFFDRFVPVSEEPAEQTGPPDEQQPTATPVVEVDAARFDEATGDAVAVSAQQPADTSAALPVQDSSNVAPSFSEQLHAGIERLPLAPRIR